MEGFPETLSPSQYETVSRGAAVETALACAARDPAALGRVADTLLSAELVEVAIGTPVLTAVLMPPGHDADQFRKVVLDNYNMSLGSGLSKVAGKVFRIGHLGECNELTLLAALTGVEMGLSVAGIPYRAGGVDAAMKYLEQRPQGNSPAHLKVVGS